MSDEETGRRPSRTAAELRRIKDAVVNAADKREHLPQPLFWSLFHNAIKDIKIEREKIRELSELLEK